MVWQNFQRPSQVEADEAAASTNFGRFIAQPFERGWGTTVGNALRRALLSSISGAAVTAVKIDGSDHEFSVVPGVVEDVTDIILNIKRVPFTVHGDEAVFVELDATGPGEITAADLKTNQNIEVVDESVHIATLSADGHLRITLRVAPGRGYVPAEENQTEDLDLGFIPIDSAHSPVIRANFKVEQARHGKMTNFERLIVEVWTNGAVDPERAMSQSAAMIQGHLEIYLDPADRIQTPAEEEESSEPSILDQSIEVLELSIRSMNCLRNAEVGSLRDLVIRSEKQMMELRNFGDKSLREVRSKLEALGLGFGMSAELVD